MKRLNGDHDGGGHDDPSCDRRICGGHDHPCDHSASCDLYRGDGGHPSWSDLSCHDVCGAYDPEKRRFN